MDIRKSVLAKARMTRRAAWALSTTPSQQRDEFVSKLADAVVRAKKEILKENQ